MSVDVLATYRDISIHAPRGGSDYFPVFQLVLLGYFNPRSPWGERHTLPKLSPIRPIISIHAPRGGSDL